MTEELKVVSKETLQQKYARLLSNDKEMMNKYQPGPNSWAYCSLDLENSTAMTEDE